MNASFKVSKFKHGLEPSRPTDPILTYKEKKELMHKIFLDIDKLYHNAARSIENAENHFENFKYFEEREVVDSYYSDGTKPEATCILVKGYEHSYYWDYEEYSTGVVEEEDDELRI